ncbi:hypothetical protein PR202_ga04203 [Eleusine coracana subsp. coracana]|uniref:Secreted protein n=1 Tax=Eleusine coracana subsp. coracana TaxID=191504 RepID=A0AAV5BR09_ELECO|nr:hypothetical protein PR202_ga04203 [Eleusine coracana subsp. coracana]
MRSSSIAVILLLTLAGMSYAKLSTSFYSKVLPGRVRRREVSDEVRHCQGEAHGRVPSSASSSTTASSK